MLTSTRAMQNKRPLDVPLMPWLVEVLRTQRGRPIQEVGRRAEGGHDHRVLALFHVFHVFQRLVEVEILDR